MFPRLKAPDALGYLHPLPPWLGQVLIALLCVAGMVLVRACVDQAAPGAGPFALMYPAVMVATMFGRWQAGMLALAVMHIYAWYFLLLPFNSFAFTDPVDFYRTIVNGAAGAAVVFFAEIIRRAFAGALAQRDQRIAEQAGLLREIDHRVKNNFALVVSLLALQRRQITSDEARDAIQLAEARIGGIARAHAHLYAGQWHDEHVQMAEYLGGLCTALAQMLGTGRNIRLAADIKPAVLARDRALHLGLIVNELVTNAEKHAFAGRAAGEIHVAFGPLEDGYRLVVADNGIGLPPQVRQGASGQKIIDAFCRQAGGTLEMATGDTGTRYTLTLKN